jgi:hypothetical protein
MYIFQLLVVLGASVLALGVPTGNIEQSGLASGDLDKRFYYNSYIDKRDTNENNGVDNTSTTTTTVRRETPTRKATLTSDSTILTTLIREMPIRTAMLTSAFTTTSTLGRETPKRTVESANASSTTNYPS